MTLATPRRTIPRATLLMMILVFSVGPLGLGGPASAIPTSTDPVPTWMTSGGEAGRVWDAARVGNRVYLGGAFTEVTDGTDTKTRLNVAAFRADTGLVVGKFRPDFNDVVHELELSPDGSILWVTGDFSEIDGVTRKRVAAFDAVTGDLLPWQGPAINSGTVHAAAVTDDVVYIGGAFETVGGETREHLAALDANTGALLDWTPTIDDDPTPGVREAPFGMGMSPNGKRVLVGGEFISINGEPESGFLAAVFSLTGTSPGEVVPEWKPYPLFKIYDIEVTPERIYTAGGGGGGKVTAWEVDQEDSSPVWERTGDGDVEAVEVVGNVVYAGGHFDNFSGQVRARAVALTTKLGALLDWNPALSTVGPDGTSVSSIESDELDQVYFLGTFTHVNAVQQSGFALFANDGVDFSKAGTCTQTSTKEVSYRSGNLQHEVIYEVVSGVSGQNWRVTMKNATTGEQFFNQNPVTTQDPDGSWQVSGMTQDAFGEDSIVLRASTNSTGENCKTKVRI